MKFKNTGAEKSTITREVNDFIDKTDIMSDEKQQAKKYFREFQKILCLLFFIAHYICFVNKVIYMFSISPLDKWEVKVSQQ
jgi:hypothetical protein